MLVSGPLRKTCEKMVAGIGHVALLEGEIDFLNVFAEGCMLQPMDVARLG